MVETWGSGQWNNIFLPDNCRGIETGGANLRQGCDKILLLCQVGRNEERNSQSFQDGYVREFSRYSLIYT